MDGAGAAEDEGAALGEADGDAEALGEAEGLGEADVEGVAEAEGFGDALPVPVPAEARPDRFTRPFCCRSAVPGSFEALALAAGVGESVALTPT